MGHLPAWFVPHKVAQALLVLLFCLFSLTSAADAAKKKKSPPPPDLSMQFAVVRGSNPFCEPHCPEWIWADGEIRSDTAQRLKKFLKTLGKRKLPLIIQSPGGDVDAALAMGRMIRAKGLDVAVGYTTFTSCAPRQKDCDAAKKGGYTGVAAPAFAYCNSACPLVLAGGVRRLVGAWAHLGVHQVTTTIVKQKILYRTTTRIVKGKKVVSKKIVSRKNAGTTTTTKMSKGLRRKLTTYLTEMGVSAALIEPMNKTAASDILRLDQSELLTFKLITSLDQLDALTNAAICKAEPVPANCRELAADEYAAFQAKAGRPVDGKAAAKAQTETKADKAEQADLAKPDKLGLMRFMLVRGSDPLCEPDCPEWISAEGTIAGNTHEKLRRLLDKLGDRQLPIVINSPGGDVLGALAAGRLIRARGLDVAVARTHFLGCAETKGCVDDSGTFVALAIDDDGECGSACSLMLAGGVRRLVGPDARLTIHSLGPEVLVAEYLDEMAIKPILLAMMQPVKAPKYLQLSPDGMAWVGLTTSRASAGQWTSPAICKAEPQPKNCRRVSLTQ